MRSHCRRRCSRVWRWRWWRIVESDSDLGCRRRHPADVGCARKYAHTSRVDTYAGSVIDHCGSDADSPGRIDANDYDVCGRRGRHSQHVDAQ